MMNFETKLRTLPPEQIWDEYCSFLDMSIDEYMLVQKRLLMEQIELLSNCPLGKRLLKGNVPKTVDEFRATVPLTTFDDYDDILLTKKEEMLPAKPAIWLKTTWEGGTAPAKFAPYSDAMLETYKNNILASALLATSTKRGQFSFKRQAKVLYGLAPLPYATGLFPYLINPEISLNFMPSLKDAKKLSFSQQSSVGFQQALTKGLDLFFGMSSIIYGISRNFNLSNSKNGGLKSILKMKPVMLVRLLRALYKSKRDGTPIYPKDLFSLTGFVCAGTDSELFKDELELFWGRRPLEICGGTEGSCMGTETWSKDGMVFFPDACFYEFIPEEDMYRNLRDPSYTPRTYLMNELNANECYELVLTVLKGGAFARYRIGDVFRCLRTKNVNDKLDIPQFSYVDRIPTVIDIMGFTRITEQEIDHIIELSNIHVSDYFALKEYDEEKHSFLHMYIELDSNEIEKRAVGVQLLRDQLSACFCHYDTDFSDLKKLLGIEPLKITLLPTGIIKKYNARRPYPIRKINPHYREVLDLMRSIKN